MLTDNQHENTAIRDVLLKIGNLSPIFSIFNILKSQTDLRKLLDHCSPQVFDALNTSTVETHATR